MNINCSLETRVSKKGNTYEVLVLKLSDTCEKLVFLEPAELELLKIRQANTEKNTMPWDK